MLGPPPPIRFCSLLNDPPPLLPSSMNVLFEWPLEAYPTTKEQILLPQNFGKFSY